MKKLINEDKTCPAQELIKMLSGKFKPEIFKLSVAGPIRFNSLLRQIKGSNKQTLSVALKELESIGILEKVIIQLKPLHIEYKLTVRGQTLIPIFEQLETI